MLDIQRIKFQLTVNVCNCRVTIDPVSLSFSHEGVTTSINLVQLQKKQNTIHFYHLIVLVRIIVEYRSS